MKKRKYNRVLAIAGSDSGGGAGIQADLKAISACGGYGMSAITAITAQNTKGVQGIHAVPVEMITQQIRSVMDDIGADAVKIGMLHNPEVIQCVASLLREYNPPAVVLDPVMVATSGDALLQEEAIKTLVDELIPLADLITPNIPEAGILLQEKLLDTSDLAGAARKLSLLGCKAVLLKSGHRQEQTLRDVLYVKESGKVFNYDFRKINTPNTHGTGCTLSSAITAYLAGGFPLPEAVNKASKYIHKAIEAGASYQMGKGHGPVHHFYDFWN